jgi:hypothetical protein
VPKTPVTSATLGQLADGYLGKLIDKALADLYADMTDRGLDDKLVRTLEIKVAFKGDRDQVGITPKVTTRLPAMVPPETIAKIDRITGTMQFNPDNSANPEQKTFADRLADDELAE